MTRLRRRAGFSLAEMVVVTLLVGVAASIIVPRFVLSDAQLAFGTARELAADLEQVRDRAESSATNARVLFDATGGAYDAFLDRNHDGVFAYSAAERDSLGAFVARTVEPPVRFGRGSRIAVPGYPEAEAVSFSGAAVTFDPRGLLQPLGDRGVVYLHTDDTPDALAAVTVSGSGAVRVWRWTEKGWE